MRKRIKRSVSIVLASMMLCTMPGMTAAAEEYSENTEVGVAAQDATEELESDNTVGDGENTEDNSGSSDIDNGAGEDGAENDGEDEQQGNTDGDNDSESDLENPEDSSEDQKEQNPEENQDEEETVVEEEYMIDASVFDDIEGGEWYAPSVTFTVNKGIMTGKGNNKFAPGHDITRGEFVVVLYRMSGSPEIEFVERFPDVKEDAFYADAVTWASQESVGVISGYENGKFGPNNPVTREEMATILFRYAEYNGFDTETAAQLEAFPDAEKVSEFAKAEMEWAVGVGIISGDQGNLNPQGLSNRAVGATMIKRFYDKYMQGQLENLDYSASCSSVTASVDDKDLGTFNVTVSDPQAALEIAKIQVVAYTKSDKSDMYVYTMEFQSDNTYKCTADVTKHGYSFGTYTIEACVLLTNNVRISMDATTLEVEGKESTVRINRHVNRVYNEVGKDLNACYWWVVNNMSYQTLEIHVTPPSGYTRAEWYAVIAFEQGKGNCYCYAAAFYWLAAGLGYDAEYIEGQVGMASGGYGPHGWVAIYQDGTTYICDPEAQDEPHLSQYNFYMQPKSSPVLQYIWP